MRVGRLEIPDENTAKGVAALEQIRAAYLAKPSVGERFSVPREDGKLPVPVLIYRPAEKTEQLLPVFFNMHGGAWLGGDAMLMESFCQLLANSIPAVVVNINYHKADVIPITEMSKEACDCVTYFQDHAEEFGVDPDRMAIGGHSAGANITAGTVLRLMENHRRMKMQVLVYPCVDLRPEINCDWMNGAILSLVPEGNLGEIHMSPLAAEDEKIKGMCTTLIVTCGKDDLRPHGIAYGKKLIENGVSVHFKEYALAEHGFLETNRPDYEPANDTRINEEQDGYARDCEQWLIKMLRAEL